MEYHTTLKSISLKVCEIGKRKSVGFSIASVEDLCEELGSQCLVIKISFMVSTLKLNPCTCKLNSK
jgi:hypothetical protein